MAKSLKSSQGGPVLCEGLCMLCQASDSSLPRLSVRRSVCTRVNAGWASGPDSLGCCTAAPGANVLYEHTQHHETHKPDAKTELHGTGQLSVHVCVVAPVSSAGRDSSQGQCELLKSRSWHRSTACSAITSCTTPQTSITGSPVASIRSWTAYALLCNTIKWCTHVPAPPQHPCISSFN